MQSILSVKNLSKVYFDRVIFENVDLSVAQNDIVVLMGENGCGKSTLLKIMAGLIGATAGEITRRPETKISFVPDNLPKLPFTVEEYLIHMANIQSLPKSHINGFIGEYFGHLNMPLDFRKTKITNCSKGTIQKVNILQSIIIKPDLLILDEPFSGLDENSLDKFLNLLQSLATSGMGIVMACHEKNLAQKITKNIYTFKDKGVKNDYTIS